MAEKSGTGRQSLRSKSREFAMQMIFQWDVSKQEAKALEKKFWRAAKADESTQIFANKLFEGTSQDVAVLDEFIVKHAENWKFERLAAIDKAVLRLAIYELRLAETPYKVVLNEAVELAKKFSSEESGSFVNGVLDAARKSMG